MLLCRQQIWVWISELRVSLWATDQKVSHSFDTCKQSRRQRLPNYYCSQDKNSCANYQTGDALNAFFGSLCTSVGLIYY